jgi:hypothetical protein
MSCLRKNELDTEWKRLPGQLFNITEQVCKAFCLHHEPCSWSTSHVGELVTTQEIMSLSFIKATSTSCSKHLTTWSNPKLLPEQQTSLHRHSYFPNIYLSIIFIFTVASPAPSYPYRFSIFDIYYFLSWPILLYAPVHAIPRNFKITYLVNVVVKLIPSNILLHFFSRGSIYSNKTHSIHDHPLQYKDNYVPLKSDKIILLKMFRF